MNAPLAVVLRLRRTNRYSFLALEAALEAAGLHPHIALVISREARIAAFFQQLEPLLERHERVLVAYSILSAQLERLRPEIERLCGHRERHRLVLVGGGPHVAGTPKASLALGFDAVCTGEGETAFPRLVDHLRQGATLASFTSPGFYVSVNGKLRFTGKAPRAPLGDLPCHSVAADRFGPIEISRGCPFRCRYCQTPVLQGSRMRHRPVEAVVDAAKRMVASGRFDIRFITPNALAYESPDGRTVSLERIGALLTGIRRVLPAHGRIFFGTFPSEVRPECVTAEALRLIRLHCDNTRVVLGGQSASPAMLERMRRGHTPGNVIEACSVILEAGMQPVVDFMLGLPGETVDQMRETLAFMEMLSRQGTRMHLHAFMPLPGTPWAALRPTPIPREIRRGVERLITDGKLFGQWKSQEGLAAGFPGSASAAALSTGKAQGSGSAETKRGTAPRSRMEPFLG